MSVSADNPRFSRPVADRSAALSAWTRRWELNPPGADLQSAASPISFSWKTLAGATGFEPANNGFGDRRSSNRASPLWCAPLDSNQHVNRV